MCSVLTVVQVIQNAQQSPDYRRALTSIANMFKNYAHQITDTAKDAANSVSVSDEDEKLQQAAQDLKKFVERLANKSLDDVTAAGQKVSLLPPQSQVNVTDYLGRPPRISDPTTSSLHTSPPSSNSSSDACMIPAMAPLKSPTVKPLRSTTMDSLCSRRTTVGKRTPRNCKTSLRLWSMGSRMINLPSISSMLSKISERAYRTPVKSVCRASDLMVRVCTETC